VRKSIRGFVVSDCPLFDHSRLTIHDFRYLVAHRIRQIISPPPQGVIEILKDVPHGPSAGGTIDTLARGEMEATGPQRDIEMLKDASIGTPSWLLYQ
jgi:hypothetical protein